MRDLVKRKTGESGFTLLELLIAIAIFSIIVSFVYASLNTVLNSKQRNDEYLAWLAKLQLGLNLMERDIEQSVNRPIRNEFGDTQGAMISGSISGLLLELTRGGHANPMLLPRSDLQRVGYQLDEEKLYRLTWPALDRAQETEPRRQLLFDGVKDVDLTFFDQGMERRDQWPPSTNLGNDQPVAALPKGIEVNLELDKWGKLRRLFHVSEAIPMGEKE